MTDKTESKKTLTLGKTLQLKKSPDSDSIRQSFGHGKSKTVTVEVKRKRSLHSDGVDQQSGAEPKINLDISQVAEASARDQNLTNSEFDTRRRALEEAIKRHQEEEVLRKKQEEERALEEQEKLKQQPITPVQESDHDSTNVESLTIEPILEQGQVVDHNPDVQIAENAKSETSFHDKGKKTIKARSLLDEDDLESESKKNVGVKIEVKKVVVERKDYDQPRRINRNFIDRALKSDGEELGRTRSIASIKRARQKDRFKNQLNSEPPQKVIREVIIPDMISVQELSNRMAVRGADVIKELMKLGMLVTINQLIDADTAELVCTEFGHKFKRVSEDDVLSKLGTYEDLEEDLASRGPVVTVMGHVDHGKTSLLDALRKTDVVSGESGGITQHIGAYQITLENGAKITFIDTPGHAAFSQMRARGAKVTDIIILVVAADDGVNQQTIEAISHAKAAEVPIIVAINKIDKEDADPARVRSELLSHEIVLEEFGGDVMSVEVSAKKSINLDKLEEAILLQAEILELKANIKRPAQGVVIESRMDKGRGPIATILVQQGQLKAGENFVAGAQWGRVKALINDHGVRIDVAGPSLPVEILGFDSVPNAGDEFFVVESDVRAREIAEYKQQRDRAARVMNLRGSMEQIMSQIAAGEAKELPLVIKADVQGSLEAIQSSLTKLNTQEVQARFLHGGVGAINESDITLARASGGIVIGFNVRANQQARDLARRDNVDIRYYSIIYNVIDDIKSVLGGLLAPTLREKFLGIAEIREVFSISKTGKIAGCYVTEGMVKRGVKVRLLRDNVVIHEGDLKTLRRFKDEVREVKQGYECGMAFENYDDIAVGDVIECFEMESIAREL